MLLVALSVLKTPFLTPTAFHFFSFHRSPKTFYVIVAILSRAQLISRVQSSNSIFGHQTLIDYCKNSVHITACMVVPALKMYLVRNCTLQKKMRNNQMFLVKCKYFIFYPSITGKTLKCIYETNRAERVI